MNQVDRDIYLQILGFAIRHHEDVIGSDSYKAFRVLEKITGDREIDDPQVQKEISDFIQKLQGVRDENGNLPPIDELLELV